MRDSLRKGDAGNPPPIPFHRWQLFQGQAMSDHTANPYPGLAAPCPTVPPCSQPEDPGRGTESRVCTGMLPWCRREQGDKTPSPVAKNDRTRTQMLTQSSSVSYLPFSTSQPWVSPCPATLCRQHGRGETAPISQCEPSLLPGSFTSSQEP